MSHTNSINPIEYLLSLLPTIYYDRIKAVKQKLIESNIPVFDLKIQFDKFGIISDFHFFEENFVNVKHLQYVSYPDYLMAQAEVKHNYPNPLSHIKSAYHFYSADTTEHLIKTHSELMSQLSKITMKAKSFNLKHHKIYDALNMVDELKSEEQNLSDVYISSKLLANNEVFLRLLLKDIIQSEVLTWMKNGDINEIKENEFLFSFSLSINRGKLSFTVEQSTIDTSNFNLSKNIKTAINKTKKISNVFLNNLMCSLISIETNNEFNLDLSSYGINSSMQDYIQHLNSYANSLFNENNKSAEIGIELNDSDDEDEFFIELEQSFENLMETLSNDCTNSSYSDGIINCGSLENGNAGIFSVGSILSYLMVDKNYDENEKLMQVIKEKTFMSKFNYLLYIYNYNDWFNTLLNEIEAEVNELWANILNSRENGGFDHERNHTDEKISDSILHQFSTNGKLKN